MFFETKVSEEHIKNLENILNFEKKVGNGVLFNSSCTKYGFQTNTVHENLKYQQTLKELLLYLPVGFQNLKYRWFHLIDYEKGGWQEGHDHSTTEDFSFIVYLTTCNSGGKTMFRISESTTLTCSPTRGNMVVFPATMWHWGEKVIDLKQIAVGALIKP